MSTKTIYALSTVYGKSGVAVIRISGENALFAIKAMTKLNCFALKPREAYFAKIFHSKTHDLIDHALVLYFKSPHSFTGEDVVEIHCHGSKAVLSSILESLSNLNDFHLAEPGEFSKRAFYHQKMDLTQAEGLADLIDAETTEQQKQALRQISGNLKSLYSSWRQELLDVLAYLEAYIDFPEEDIPDSICNNILNTVFKLKTEIQNHLELSNFGERLREGFRVVMTGRVNAGKSSLLNALIERQAAIVSDTEGTTRDAIDVHLDIAGYPVILTDTAGLRETTDNIEKQGVQIAQQKACEADLVLAVFDASKESPESFQTLINNQKNILLIANKCDMISDEQRSELQKAGFLTVSAKTKEGLPLILEKIKFFVQERLSPASGLLITRARYRENLQECLLNLSNFNFNKEIELSAEDIRLASRAIGKITGQIEINEILDKIFGSFCIGK